MCEATIRALLSAYDPALVPLTTNLTAAVFPLMKVIPAEYCLRGAAGRALVQRQTLVLESSSGTMGLALSIVGRLLGYRIVVVTDYAVDDVLRRRMEELGSVVERVPAPAAEGGYQRARLDRLQELRRTYLDHWWVNQYDNPEGARAYESFGAGLVKALGRVDCLVGTVGTGGSVCGAAAYLSKTNPELFVIGVDTFNSVLFGQPDGKRRLRGLGNSILPRNVDHSAFDEIHWVSAAEAYLATRQLYRRTTLFRGGTSGAAWMVASHWAARHPRSKVVCIFPDDGTRYVHEIYDDRYLLENDLCLSVLPEEPEVVAHPSQAKNNWSMFHWKRRAYAEVMQSSPFSLCAV
jgi:cysteine synthase A